MARYLWKQQWTWLFESAWSILEKFKYANAATNDIFKTALNMKSTVTSTQTCNNLWIYRKAVVDIEKFIDFFNIPKEHFSPLNSLKNNDLYNLVKEDLCYCPICMRVGYHSYLFQLSFIYKCPFHNVDLVEAKFDGKPISYCIELKQSEAYCTMQDKTNSPAMKYLDIKNARELIDVIWDNSSIQKRMLTPSITDIQIIFFSPYANTISSMNISVLKSRDILLNGLFFRTSNDKIVPYLTVTEKQCERAFTSIQNTARDWYEEKDLLFHKSDMEGWYIYSVIHKLLTKVYDYPKFNEVLTNMQMQSFIYEVDMIDFMDISSVLVTALMISNAISYAESIDLSIIYHHYNHMENLCKFSLYDLQHRCLRSITEFHEYLSFLIYDVLVDKLYKRITELIHNDYTIAFDLNAMLTSIIFEEQIVIVKENDIYNIYKLE